MEQSYKEKYEDILARLERAKNDNEVCDERFCCVIDDIIPELAENKDEKVRKALKQYFVNSFRNNGVAAICGVHVKDVLAWLEKQGQVKESFISQHEIETCKENNNSLTKGYDSIDLQFFKPGDSYCQENCKRFRETGKCFADGMCKAKREAEQKPEENKGNIGGISPDPEWSEEDEPQKGLAETYLAVFDKKFPILPTLKGKRLADYKNFLNKCQQIFGLKYWGIHPRQAKLFEKLSLLWAAWGAEYLQGLGQTYGDMDDEILWSEEDEHRIKDTIYFLDTAKKHYASTEELDACIDWLKSIKGRVQQPKKK